MVSKEHNIRFEILVGRAGYGIVSSRTLDIPYLKWSYLVHALAMVYNECKSKLPNEDFDNTTFTEQETL